MPIFESRTRAAQPELIRTISYPYRQHGRDGTSLVKGKSHSRRRSLFLLMVPLCILSWLLLMGGDEGSGTTPEDSSAAAALPVPEPIKILDYTSMDATINSVIAANPGMDIGISTIDIKTGDTKTYGVQEVFVAASTAKLLTAIAYLHDVEQGNHTLTESIRGRTAQSALETLIVDSDNQAWIDLNYVAMSSAELASYAETIGFTNYNHNRNTTTATSLATLLGNLYNRKLLNEQHTSLLLSYMERAKNVEYIPDSVPDGVRVYHKPGYLADRVHDAAIIDDGKRPYVLVIFTKARNSVYNNTAGAAVFNEVAAATYQTFLDYRPENTIQ
jgi:beta-lactamase class A